MDRLFETEKEGNVAVATDEDFEKTQEKQEKQEKTEKKQEKEQNFQQNLQFSGNFENSIQVCETFSSSTPKDETRKTESLDPNMTIGQAMKANAYANSFGEKTIAEYLREKQLSEQEKAQAQPGLQTDGSSTKQNAAKNENFSKIEQKADKNAENLEKMQLFEQLSQEQQILRAEQPLQEVAKQAEENASEKPTENVQILQQQETQDVSNTQNFPQESKPVNIIEKPNYDLIEESKTIVKLTKKTQTKKKKVLSKKVAGLCLALSLGATTAVFLGNFIALDQISSSFQQIEQEYSFNLFKYLKNLNNLDATKKSMEFVETYPEDILDAGDLGQKTNWFDKFCNFIGGLFGG